MRKITALTDEQLIQFYKELSIGTRVYELADDPEDPYQLGTVVEPTADELAVLHSDYCGSDDYPPYYILVAWSWPDTPNEVFDRCWEALDDLQKVED
jgi:hypothetical protein